MKLRLAFLWLLVALVGQGAAQTVSTIVRSTSPASGPLEPYGIAVDPDENLYITDPASQRIFRFRMSTGEYTVLAGKAGDASYVNGSLTQARFSDPRGIIYARGGLVVADSGNHALRYINLTNGTVTTLAGAGLSGQFDGPASSAQFRLPRGLVQDKLGNIFVSDYRSKNIRRLDVSDIVSTYAVGFDGPSGLDVADDGRLFVADRAGNVIRTVETNGVVSIFAGSGTQGAADAEASLDATFSLPDATIWLGTNFGLLICDAENHSLRRVFSNPEVGGYSVETYAGLSGTPGFVDGSLVNARFNAPASLVKFLTGFLMVDEQNRAIRQILVSPVPPRIIDPAIGHIEVFVDPTSGSELLKLVPVTDAIFNNEVTIGIRGEANVRHLWTSGPGRTNIFDPDLLPDPDLNSPTAAEFFDGVPPSKRPPTLTGALPILTVKAISSAPGRTASSLVEATFRFQVATPSIDAVANPGNLTFLNSTTNAVMYYTLDGSEPSNLTSENPSTRGPIINLGRIPMVLGKSNLVVKVKGYLDNYSPSQTANASFSPTNFVGNRISLGFSGGEASSEFVAAAGQRFYAPVTLTTILNQKMYGMSFNVQVENLTGPAPAFNSDYSLSFTSSLKEKLVGTYRTITNGAFLGVANNISSFQQIIGGVTNTVFVTNRVSLFTNLFFTDTSKNLIGIGWQERFGSANLYDTTLQDLISYSQPHDTLFDSKNRKVVVGAASFVVPGSAAAGGTYQMKIGRASANSDGVAEDVIIEMPDGSDTNVLIKAVQTVTVASRHYLVGDVAPFRWFNAGDFGDNTVVNSDLEQLHQAVAYDLNLPPPGSDMLDAMDTCCVTTNIIGYTTNLTIFTNLAIVTNITVTDIVNLTTNFDVVNFADFLTNPIITTNFAFSTNLITTNLYEVLTNYLVTTNFTDPLDPLVFVLVTNLVDVVTNFVSSTNVADISTNLTYITNDVITTNLITVTNISGYTTNLFALTNTSVLTNLVTTTNSILKPRYLNVAGTFGASNGDDQVINQVGFGDGTLDVADLFVAFRRAVDPALVNYERYWSNGLLQAVTVSNLFRGTASVASGRVHAKAVDEGNGEDPSAIFTADSATVQPGQVVEIPIRASIKGGLPIRALLMRLKVEAIDGNIPLSQPVSFIPSVEMGQPSQAGVQPNDIYAASWLDTAKAGIRDSAVVGVLRVPIPTNAAPNSVFLVRIEHMSGSPNGIFVLPSTNFSGVVTMSARSAQAWNDGIPDAWRVQYFGSLLNMLSAPDADADGDGMSNMAEFKAGTNPTDFNSKLKLNSEHASGVFTLRWPSGTNAVYNLESSPTLDFPVWTTVQDGLVGTGEMMIYQPQLPDAATRFYRIHLKD